MKYIIDKVQSFPLALKLFLIFFFIILIIFLCFKSNSNQYQTIIIQYGDIKQTSVSSGHIVPLNAGQVKSTLSGTVVKLFVDAGNYVKKGDPLIQIQPNPTPEDLVLSKKIVDDDKESLSLAKDTFQRMHALYLRHLISRSNMQIAQSAYNKAQIDYYASLQNYLFLTKGEMEIGEKKITGFINSPMNGYILQRNVSVGNSITSTSENQYSPVIFLIADLKNMIFQGSVDELDILNIKKGQKAEITLASNPNEKIFGTVEHIGIADVAYTDINVYKADTNSSAKFSIRIKIDWPKNIIPRAGYSAIANILIKEVKHVLILPLYSINFENDLAYVYVLRNKKIKKVYIALGVNDGIFAEVKKGLFLGDKVIISRNI